MDNSNSAALTAGSDGEGNGWLKMQPNANDYGQGAFYLNRDIPASVGAVMEFDYVGHTTSGRMDHGFVVFLKDAGIPFEFGGGNYGIGYANHNTPGMPGAYMGLAFDTRGCFGSSLTGAGNDVTPCPSPFNHADRKHLILRGASGEDYLLKSNANTVDNLIYTTATPTRPTSAQFYRRVHVAYAPKPGGGYTVKASWKTSPTGTFTEIFSGETDFIAPERLHIGITSVGHDGVSWEIRDVRVGPFMTAVTNSPVLEGDKAVVMFHLDHSRTNDVTFKAATVDGEAKSGENFVGFTDQEVTIPLGVTKAVLEIQTLDDNTINTPNIMDFSVMLSHVNGLIYDGNPIRIEIIDNNGSPLNLLLQSVNSPIKGNDAVLRLELEGGVIDVANPVEFTVSAQDGSALADRHYKALDYQRFSFAPGSRTYDLHIETIDDGIPSGERTFNVIINTASGASIPSGELKAEVIIQDPNNPVTPMLRIKE